MRYKIYTKTEQAWDAMLETLRGAQSSIFFEMYIFLDDTSATHNFVEVLCRKAKAGLRVKIIVDSLGSGDMSSSAIRRLKEAGAEFLIFSGFIRRTHRKILVVDEEVAFIGGINIEKFFRKWGDLQIRIEGKIVKHIIKSFARMYERCGGRDPYVLRYKKVSRIQEGKIWFFEHFPPSRLGSLNREYIKKIKGAKEKISIFTPYFMPGFTVFRALRRAAERGVSVEIILPKKVDRPAIANISNYHYMHRLYQYGVKFFLTNEIIHSKLLLIDGREGALGSQNLDIFSFDLNMESGIFFTEEQLVSDLAQIIADYKKDAVPYTPKMRNNYFLDHLTNFCLSSFIFLVKLFNRLVLYLAQ